jgi:hypothetical protein
MISDTVVLAAYDGGLMCFISTVFFLWMKRIYEFSVLVLSSYPNVGLEGSDFSFPSASVDFSLTFLF